MNIILIKNEYQIAPFGGYILNFLHVWGTFPLRLPLGNGKNSKLLGKKEMNKMYIY